MWHKLFIFFHINDFEVNTNWNNLQYVTYSHVQGDHKKLSIYDLLVTVPFNEMDSIRFVVVLWHENNYWIKNNNRGVSVTVTMTQFGKLQMATPIFLIEKCYLQWKTLNSVSKLFYLYKWWHKIKTYTLRNTNKSTHFMFHV